MGFEPITSASTHTCENWKSNLEEQLEEQFDIRKKKKKIKKKKNKKCRMVLHGPQTQTYEKLAISMKNLSTRQTQGLTWSSDSNLWRN